MTSGPVLLFDYQRTPYAIAGAPHAASGSAFQVGWVGAEHRESRLYWILDGSSSVPARWILEGIPVVARVVDDDAVTPVLRALGGTWEPALAMKAARGSSTASVWTRGDGSFLLPFDPDEAIRNLWSEAYLGQLSPLLERATARGTAAYYRIRPALPLKAQISFRRALARRQARTKFPRWPVEPALHDLYDLLFGLVYRVVGQPVPALAPWPSGHSWALLLTHDVESADGLAGIEVLRTMERRHGRVSAWNFVPKRYDTPGAVRADLVREGCEIGIHGLNHDGHDVESEAALLTRLPEIHAYARSWGVTGFRAPSMQRSWSAMRRLGFDHDLSFPDTDPFQPCRGGCCTWWPMMNGPVVELPLTLPQDHTLFVILLRTGASTWIDKTRLLRDRGGLAQLLVHPDYIRVPGVLDAYEAYLDAFAHDETAWHALPSQVSAWWRARAASDIVDGDDGWKVVGPAAPEAEVILLPGSGSRADRPYSPGREGR